MLDKKDYQYIQTQWANIQTLPPREKYNELKKLCFQIPYSGPMTPEEINFYKKLLYSAKKLFTFPEKLNGILQAIFENYLQYLNIDINQLKVIRKKNVSISLNTATMGIGDKSVISLENQDSKKLMLEGKRIFFSTAGDGEFPIKWRFINLPEPIYNKRESKNIIQYSDIYTLHLPTGIIALTDFDSPVALAEFEVEPGDYKMCMVVFRDYVYGICFAKVTPLSVIQPNNVEIECLQG